MTVTIYRLCIDGDMENGDCFNSSSVMVIKIVYFDING